jgi:hypothetical protein
MNPKIARASPTLRGSISRPPLKMKGRCTVVDNLVVERKRGSRLAKALGMY